MDQKELKQWWKLFFKYTETYQGFEVIFTNFLLKNSREIFEDNRVEVYTIPLDHRIYCNGYLFFKKTKERHLNMKEISKYPEIEICDYHNPIKRGKDFILKRWLCA